MAELLNCPNCDALFVKTNLREVCDKCYKQEEKDFETVYQFIRKRENRTATLSEVVEGTGVKEDLIARFIRTGRLRLASFPNLGYRCQKCKTVIREGNLCDNCTKDLRSQISQFEKEEAREKALKERDRNATYFNGR